MRVREVKEGEEEIVVYEELEERDKSNRKRKEKRE